MADQQLTLTVAAGPSAGARYLVADDGASVGRAADCTIVIQDASLSRRHFAIVREGGAWLLRDAGSRNGTLVNGQRIDATVLRDGDVVEAGDTSFHVGTVCADRADGASAADGRLPSGEAPPAARHVFPDVECTLRGLPAVGGAPGRAAASLLAAARLDADLRLYAVVDGARAFDLAFTGRLMGHEMFTLFDGAFAKKIAHVGPCVLELNPEPGFLDRWGAAAGKSAGVLLATAADPDALCAHLRTIFVVTDEERQEYFFRFYDPRVLRVFLPTCQEDELREFFGPVVLWVAETEDASGYETFTLEDSRLVTERAAPA